MHIHYIILAHKNPQQVKRLISRLDCDHTSFYIHIDLQADISEFKNEISGPNISYISKRAQGTWGDVGIVKGTIEAMKMVLEAGIDGYSILLSGQDYPLASNKKIKSFFENQFPTEYITVYPMPHSGWKYGGLDRLQKYKINKSKQRKHFLLLPSIFDKEFYTMESLGKLNFLRKTKRFEEISLILKRRRFPSYIQPYGGSQWWALTMNTVEAILDYINENPEFLAYHNYTLLPDEIFFQSILMKLNSQKEKKMNIERSLTYVNWERPQTPLPVTFEINDFKELKEGAKDHLFARKFDIQVDEDILNSIDQNLLKNY